MRLLRNLLLSSIGLASPLLAHANELKIASWNLQNFAGQNNTGCKERVQSDYDEIKKVITSVDADVWLFQEIESTGALARIMDPNLWTFHTESRSDWSSMPPCFNNDRRAVMQRVSIAAKKGLVVGKKEDLPFIDTSGRGTLRYGVAVNIVKSGRTIHLINVHLKSGCHTGNSSRDCPTLFSQFPLLASYINEMAEADVPVIVGGDFNRLLSKPEDEAFSSLSYSKRTALQIASNKGPSKCSLKSDENIDYILTNSNLRDFFDVEETSERAFEGKIDNWPSDHCPITVTFQLK